MRAPTWHALYTSTTKSMPYPKTLPSAQLMGDNSGYNRPGQNEEMEMQFNQCNRHQPEMSQRLIWQCLLKAKGSVIFINPCCALCRRKSLQKGHSPFWPSFAVSDIDDKKNYYYFSMYILQSEGFTLIHVIMIIKKK